MRSEGGRPGVDVPDKKQRRELTAKREITSDGSTGSTNDRGYVFFLSHSLFLSHSFSFSLNHSHSLTLSFSFSLSLSFYISRRNSITAVGEWNFTRRAKKKNKRSIPLPTPLHRNSAGTSIEPTTPSAAIRISSIFFHFFFSLIRNGLQRRAANVFVLPIGGKYKHKYLLYIHKRNMTRPESITRTVVEKKKKPSNIIGTEHNVGAVQLIDIKKKKRKNNNTIVIILYIVTYLIINKK